MKMSKTELSKKFMFIVQEMHENRLRMNRKFYNEMFRNKKENALKKWQKMLTDDLNFTAKWSTQLVDCQVKSKAYGLNTDEMPGVETLSLKLCTLFHPI